MADPPGQSPPAPGAPAGGMPGGARPSVPPRLLFAAVCCLGISAIVTQLVLMRELLCVLAGNEMILGIILGNWFLLTGLGALLGRRAGRRRSPLADLIVAHLLVAVLPVALAVLLRVLRNVVFVRGAEVGVAQSVLSCFVLLAPYCLIAGYVLPLACRLLAARRDAASIGEVYFLDVLGDIVGGLLFSFVLVHLVDRLGHLAILYVPAALNLAAALAVAVAARQKALAVLAGAVVAGAVGLVSAVDLGGWSAAIEYAGRNVVYRGSSPYGRLVVTESAGQYDFIENGVPLFSTHEPERVEETVHYAMAQRPAARQVLLVAGGVSGTAREILKWPVRRVDYVELDPLIVRQARRIVPASLADPRIRVHATDGRLFVRQTDRRYDVAIVDVPDPSTFQINRFYTVEFFRHVKGILVRGGVLAVSLGGYENYVSEDLARLIGVVRRTLRAAFAGVRILPGGRVFFLASDGDLTSDLAGRIERAGVETQWVRRDVLRGTLTDDRIAQLDRAAAGEGPINRDFTPVLYYYQLLYWSGKYPLRYGAAVAAALAALAIYLLRLRPVTLAVFTTGFAASALEVVLLVGFQIAHGSVYHMVGLIVTAFMIGLAVGSLLANRWLRRWARRDLVKVELAVAAYAALLPLALMALDWAHGTSAGRVVSAHVAFPLLTGGLACLVGLEFPVAGRADFQTVSSTASRLYTADYLGACVGALLVSTLLIPLVGIPAVCLIVAALNVASGLIVRFT